MYITINGKAYRDDVAQFFADFNQEEAAAKHRKTLIRVAKIQRTPTAYRCGKCGETVLSMVPVRWCPVGEHFMSQPRERLQAGWRYVA